MATPTALAIRRAEALDRAKVALDAIAGHTGVAVEDFPPLQKRTETQGAVEAEWMAGALETIASAVAPGEFDLDAMKRDDLNAHAERMGIDDPDGYPNKAALIAAIKKGNATMNDPKIPTPEPAPEPEPAPAPPPTDEGGE